MISSEVTQLVKKYITLESTGNTCDELEESKILLSVFIINIKNRKRAKFKQITKMIKTFTFDELLDQYDFLHKRLSKQEQINILYKIDNSKGKGWVINPTTVEESNDYQIPKT